jgi:hypothetical protein
MKEGWDIIPKAEYLKFGYRNPKLETAFESLQVQKIETDV